jgi:molybdate transport system substrate-binding protein
VRTENKSRQVGTRLNVPARTTLRSGAGLTGGDANWLRKAWADCQSLKRHDCGKDGSGLDVAPRTRSRLGFQMTLTPGYECDRVSDLTVGAIGKLAMWNRIQAATAAAATVVVVTLTQQGGTAQSAELEVFSSAAPRGIFREIAPDFERTTGHRLVINYEFAADLKRRIEAGDPFDVAILPPDLADDLVRRGKLAAGSRVDLGRTGMGVAVRRGAPRPRIDTVDAFRQALLAAPTVAYANGGASGVHVQAILARLGIVEAMKQKLRPYPAGGAVEAVARGEADLVVIGVSPILDVPGVELVGWLPPELQSYIVFTGSIGAAARQADAARIFLTLLTSPAAVELFKAQGFESASR